MNNMSTKMNNMSTKTVLKYDDVINDHKGFSYKKNSVIKPLMLALILKV